MSEPKSDFLRIISERGFVHQCTDMEALDSYMSGSEPRTAYIGFDCTADSLHVGSLVPIMLLRWLQKTGHNPIVLMGGGTTKVGDPSGKDQSRKMLTDDDIQANMDGIKKVFAQYLDFGDRAGDAVMVNNDDWLKTLNYISFLRDYGPHFTINRMMTFDSVKLRLEREQPLTFLEFNYMILQAYDFMQLSKVYNCRLQMGGSDQWGNIVNGVELTRRTTSKEVFGLTVPLITTASGAKMGKTADGAVWLNAARRSPYDYWQFWRNTEDGDVVRFLKLFTELPLDEVERLGQLQGQEINEAKKVLAFEATKLCHGEEAATQAAETARQTFEQGAALASDLPTVKIATAEIEAGMAVFALLGRTGLCKTNSEARRLIKGGGAKVNDKAFTDEVGTMPMDAFNEDGVAKLSSGKKRHVLVKLV